MFAPFGAPCSPCTVLRQTPGLGIGVQYVPLLHSGSKCASPDSDCADVLNACFGRGRGHCVGSCSITSDRSSSGYGTYEIKGTPPRNAGVAIPRSDAQQAHLSQSAASASSTSRSTHNGGLIQTEAHLKGKTPIRIPDTSTPLQASQETCSTYLVKISYRILLWHNKLGHPDATTYIRMLPALEDHTLC